MTDDTSRNSPTDAAPPPSPDDIETSPHASEVPLQRRSTQPPGADDAEVAKLSARPALPPPARAPETIRELAEHELIVMQRQLLAGLTELLGDDGRLAKQTAAIAAAIDRAADKTNGTYELLRGELAAFRRAVHAKDADHDQQLADLRREVAELRARMEQDRADYERKFQEQQASVDAVNATLAELEKKP